MFFPSAPPPLPGMECVPFTSGLLIGLGESRVERLQALLSLRESHDTYGHLQEVIIQNFRAKPGTRMWNAPEPSLDELRWTVAMARIAFGVGMSIQAPPNLTPSRCFARCGRTPVDSCDESED